MTAVIYQDLSRTGDSDRSAFAGHQPDDSLIAIEDDAITRLEHLDCNTPAHDGGERCSVPPAWASALT